MIQPLLHDAYSALDGLVEIKENIFRSSEDEGPSK